MSKITVVLFYLFALLCLVIWANKGLLMALALWGIGISVYAALHLMRQWQLLQWLHKDDSHALPQASGYWADIFADLNSFKDKHQAKTAELTASMARFKHAVSVLPDGVVIFNEQQQLEWCNPAAERQLGLDFWRDQNERLKTSIHHADAVKYLESGDYDVPLTIKPKTDSSKTLSLEVYTFGAQQKIMLCHDVSQIEKLDAMRRDFIANVSHELRTPLTVVGGFIETLQDYPDAVAKAHQPHIELMAQQTARMRSLVDDLLTLSRIETNDAVPENAVISAQGLIQRVLDNAKGLSMGKHKITAEIEPNLNIIGAEEEIYSAFSNLVQNAIRYTPESGNIKVIWERVNEQPVFRVKDTGIGIEAKHIDRLTERFYRIDKSRSRDTGGTGLGLSIVKHILVRHQAQLEVESAVNKGSTFSVIFPADRVAP